MRIAVADIGTNSTRLLIGDVEDGRMAHELVRRTKVTRLGPAWTQEAGSRTKPTERVYRAFNEYKT